MLWIAILSMVLLLGGVPIAMALGLGGTLGVWLAGIPLQVIITRFFAGVDSFVFLAMPFYILAAEIMNRSGITTRLIHLSSIFTGRFPGGTAYTNVGTSVLFAGVSGSAVADASALGRFFMKVMPKEGYTKEYSAAVTAASSIIGPIIPPSGLAIIMAAVTGLSVVDLFVAGVVPGVLFGLACALVIFIKSVRSGLPKSIVTVNRQDLPKLLLEGTAVMLLPFIIVGGMVTGAFTATEGGGIAVFVAALLGLFLFRSITWADLWDALVVSARGSATIYLLVAATSILSYSLNLLGIGGVVTAAAPYFEGSPLLFLVGVMALMLFLGLFLDIGAALLIFVPLVMPTILQLGIDPIQASMVIILSLAIGLITPPVGVVLFILMKIGNIRLTPLMRELMPFIYAEIGIILLLILFPSLSTWLPNQLR
ncbi:TRAP transporter large permease [Rhizobium sp. LC145]|jgi:tripartite ATP-independent transporter DctM subunit|uniref:TRAP transporter large permease n=1 Tax=Rhizobium sp. LC145 TaxID=1120688 RepID=UPI00062A3529|nr:TRAP transporter large permease [Rhizobium sp. LC145]KKX26283.1 transporter [Rhizobium sp. LC145]TKT67227.1 TRAP transporter large permease [Rhizobiaceae bacterium LC148]